jgi:hypothetical protein
MPGDEGRPRPVPERGGPEVRWAGEEGGTLGYLLVGRLSCSKPTVAEEGS